MNYKTNNAPLIFFFWFKILFHPKNYPWSLFMGYICRLLWLQSSMDDYSISTTNCQAREWLWAHHKPTTLPGNFWFKWNKTIPWFDFRVHGYTPYTGQYTGWKYTVTSWLWHTNFHVKYKICISSLIEQKGIVFWPRLSYFFSRFLFPENE